MMTSIFKRITKSLKEKKNRRQHEILLNIEKNQNVKDEMITPSSSNITSLTSYENIMMSYEKSKSSKRNSFTNNNSDISYFKTEFNYNGTNDVSNFPEFGKENYINGDMELYSKTKVNPKKNSSVNNNESGCIISGIKEKLEADYERLKKKNDKLKKKNEKSKEINEHFKNELEKLEKLNRKLLNNNAESLHETIKHRFLKLESEDLSKRTDQCKQRLEEKENLIVQFQKQFEDIRTKYNAAYQEKEEAQLEASHSCVKLKELTHDIAELDIYQSENIQRKFYFNELQSIDGNVRVYLRMKSTVGSSCISFLANDKILLLGSQAKHSNLLCQFSHIFQPKDSNKTIFEEIEPLIASVIDGYNCCFINYGQHGSGKSFTMFGEESDPGIVYETLTYLVLETKANTNWEYDLSLSALQIHKGNVVDIFSKTEVIIVDDGENVILRNTSEKQISSHVQCLEIMKVIKNIANSFRPIENIERTFSHLLIIIRVKGVCKTTKEKTCGVVMFCELAGFENEDNLKFTGRECLKEEKHIQETLMDLGKTLVTLKMKGKKKPRTNCILTKLLYPCLSCNSKCCLFIHCFSDLDQLNTIKKSIQYGLAVMPRLKSKNNLKYTVQWDFSDE